MATPAATAIIGAASSPRAGERNRASPTTIATAAMQTA